MKNKFGWTSLVVSFLLGAAIGAPTTNIILTEGAKRAPEVLRLVIWEPASAMFSAWMDSGEAAAEEESEE